MKISIDYDELELLAKNLLVLSDEYTEINKNVSEQFNKLFEIWKSENAILLQTMTTNLQNKSISNINNTKTFSTLITLMKDNFNISEEDFNKLIMSDNNLLEGYINEKL